MLFTEKLNLKRPQHGGVNPLHQDYPYWVDVAEDPERGRDVDALPRRRDLENGCLRVVPGATRRACGNAAPTATTFAGNEIDARAYADVESVPLEAAGRSVVMFGSYLVHHSAPNTSDRAATGVAVQLPARRSRPHARRRSAASARTVVGVTTLRP